MARKDTNTMTNALKIVGGGIVGAGLALLLAPRTGKETRKEIVSFTKNMGSRTDKAVREFGHDINHFADSVGKKAARILHNGREMSWDAKKEMLTAIEKGRKRLEKQRHRLARMIG
ncbi:MAG TPA: YtxH domain-containing protein [Geobacteraceae bacterium]|jgi:gas vesicle protein|nr:YtxH domain-containing protein [Geobacteraceae bacterium]